MNYKLAKQLKEAGFPQKVRNGNVYHPTIFEADIDAIYFPTLEELIEWCGDKFLRLDSPSSIQEAFDIYEVRKAADHWNAVGRIDKRKRIFYKTNRKVTER